MVKALRTDTFFFEKKKVNLLIISDLMEIKIIEFMEKLFYLRNYYFFLGK